MAVNDDMSCICSDVVKCFCISLLGTRSNYAFVQYQIAKSKRCCYGFESFGNATNIK